MFDKLRTVLESGDVTVVESFELQPRQAAFGAIPDYLFQTPVGDYLKRTIAVAAGLWRHQAVALDALGHGRSVVVPTGTASGKSLIFRSFAFHSVIQRADARVLVFYPLKALASDQLRGWQAMARGLGLPQDIVVRIDGSVPVKQREALLQKARIVVMTPDVCHAWLMSRLAGPTIKAFLANLSIVVMDEAHTLEGVFGSNFAFLMRRILAARHFLERSSGSGEALQFVAATATILNPREHLGALTGVEFEVVPEECDGSPRLERFCAHVAAPPGEEMEVARFLQKTLLAEEGQGGFITFIDSRKGVELLARSSSKAVEDLLGSADILPYRAGYVAEDRERIERRLQAGTLRGVVSTSALELGIDLPHLTVGFNVGVPSTRKAYRQRLGRVGRSASGSFIIVAAPGAFSSFGTTFREYHDMSVEESYLYLDNRFMQFAHARCLADELEAIGAGLALPNKSIWPTGFAEVFGWAKPGGSRPPAFDAIAQMGSDAPHYQFPLRNVGEINFRIAQGDSAPGIGEANESQALRECYPGATYWHLGRAWEVQSWQTTGFTGPLIRVRAGSPNRQTRPRIRTWINAGITSTDLMEAHLLRGDAGFVAECQMQVTEKVEGYDDLHAGVYRPYSELRQMNPNMRPRIRNFRTSGVIICIDAPWFRVGVTKQRFADRLMGVFAREYSVLPQDVGSAATNISVRSLDGGGPRSDCIVVFDQTYGSLRLTERLFLHLDTLLDRMERAVEAEALDNDKQFLKDIGSVREFIGGLRVSEADASPDASSAMGKFVRVFAPGSRVSFRDAGSIGSEVEIILPTKMNGLLMYQVTCPPKPPSTVPVKKWVSAEFIEPTAGDGEWDYAWWDSETETYESPPGLAEDADGAESA